MNKKNKKKNMIISIVIIVVILGFFVIRMLPSGAEDIPVVDVVKAEKGEVTSTLSTSGTVASEVNVDYISPVNASVDKVNVVVGQTVKAGDYLLSYNTSELQSAYDLADLQDKSQQATADDSLNVSNNNAKKVADAEAKINDLNPKIDAKKNEIADINKQLSNPALSEEEAMIKRADLEEKTTELQDLQTQLEVANSEKDAAQSGVLSEQQKKSLDYNMQVSKLSVTNAQNDLSTAQAGLVSEFDGIVTNVTVTNGSMATEGQTLVTIAKTSDMKVDFTISKYNLSEVAEGQTATIEVLGNKYTGKITRMSKVAASAAGNEDASRTGVSGSSSMVAAEMHIDNPDDNLVIGIDADLSINTGEVKGVVVVSASAINEDVDGTFVYVLKNNKVVRKSVEVGLMSDESAEIKSGVKEGELVLSNIDSSVTEGMKAEANEVKLNNKTESKSKNRNDSKEDDSKEDNSKEDNSKEE